MRLMIQKWQILPCGASSTKSSSTATKDDERVNLSGLSGVFNVRRVRPEAGP
jgi:hypothetical protein